MDRPYTPLIEEYLRYFPCVVLVGARQTGKSTLIETFSANRPIFDLESRADYEQIARDPDLFLRTQDYALAIDEAQLLPELFPALRVAIDRDRSAYGKYLLSGSSSPQLLSAISESLAGRVGIIELAPFSFSETLQVRSSALLQLFSETPLSNSLIHAKPRTTPHQATPHQATLSAIEEYWFHGGYPEPWLRNEGRFRNIWREQYFKTYIERDVARLFPKLNSMRFRRFVELLAACSGDIINYSNIAKILDVSQPTVKDYFTIAQGTFLWRNLPAYRKNITKRVVKHPRGYLRDTGLLHHLLQIQSPRQLASHPCMGTSWESLVIEEILRTLNTAGIGYCAYYYRKSAGAEIDLVLEGKFGLIPFEIKHTQAVNTRHLRAVKDFVEEFHCAFAVVVNNDEKVRLYDENIYGMPFSMLTAESASI